MIGKASANSLKRGLNAYLIQYLAHDRAQKSFNLSDFIREPYFVPASKRTDELFKELQQNRMHIAVIIDEYEGTAGIVTLEDLIEEIVGNILTKTMKKKNFLINWKRIHL